MKQTLPGWAAAAIGINMTFDEIESIIGPAQVRAVQEAIQEAIVSSRHASGHGGDRAVRELLIAMLAATLFPQTDVRKAAMCVEALRETVADLISAHLSSRH